MRTRSSSTGAGRDCSRRSAATRSTRTAPTKADVVGEALRRLGHPADVIMVGDRLHDVEGARVHGLGCLGAGWGYAAPGELEEAGALAVYPDPDSLGAALHGAGTAPSGTFVA